MSEQLDDKTIVLDSVQDTLVFAYALCNLAVGDLTKRTYYRNGLSLFPLDSLRVANSKFQNYKRAIKKTGSRHRIRSRGFLLLIIPSC
jgi:hypothetical protein